jgi:hypothetical protein
LGDDDDEPVDSPTAFGIPPATEFRFSPGMSPAALEELSVAALGALMVELLSGSRR